MLVFNIPPTVSYKVIRGPGSSDRQEGPGIKLKTRGYKVKGLFIHNTMAAPQTVLEGS